MGRAQRRAQSRETTKRERAPPGSDRASSGRILPEAAAEAPETPDETARRIYRSGSKPERSTRTKRGVSEKRLKWREGRQ